LPFIYYLNKSKSTLFISTLLSIVSFVGLVNKYFKNSISTYVNFPRIPQCVWLNSIQLGWYLWALLWKLTTRVMNRKGKCQNKLTEIVLSESEYQRSFRRYTGSLNLMWIISGCICVTFRICVIWTVLEAKDFWSASSI